MCVLVAQLCPTLCYSMDCSPLGSSVHGFLQARVLEWVASSFSKGSSQPRDWTQGPTLKADSLLSEPPGKPQFSFLLYTNNLFHLWLAIHIYGIKIIDCFSPNTPQNVIVIGTLIEFLVLPSSAELNRNFQSQKLFRH